MVRPGALWTCNYNSSGSELGLLVLHQHGQLSALVIAAKSPRIAKNGTLWAALSIVFIAFGATYMGMSAKVLIPELPEGTSAYAALVMTYFPSGISGLVLVGVFAAIMSTGVVSINCCAANVSVDIYRDRVNPKAKDSTVKLLAVISSLVAGIVGAVLAWWQYDIVSLLLLAFTFQAASLFFPTVFGMFWKKPTAKAAFVSIIISMAVVLVWLICSALDVAPDIRDRRALAGARILVPVVYGSDPVRKAHA